MSGCEYLGGNKGRENSDGKKGFDNLDENIRGMKKIT